MKHATTRIVFGHWDALRGERAAPDRGDIQPGAMRHVLGDTFILTNEGEPAFRLAGSRLCALFGRELSGMPFRALWQREDTAQAEQMTDQVLHETSGIVAGVVGSNANGSQIALELILLPLRHNRRTDTRMLGALSPATLPSWAGLVPLVELEIRTVRVIATRPQDATIVPPAAMGERRQQLVVHDGGLT